jgi:polar amino acid transport system substrate-binding protein
MKVGNLLATWFSPETARDSAMSKCLLRFISASLLAAVLLTLFATNITQATDDAPISLLVFNRPPYYILDHGKPAGGFLLDIALAVLKRADIPYTVRELPPGRIMAILEKKTANTCAVGWLRTPQRETFARFSPPIYSNKSLIAVVNNNVQLEEDNVTLKALLNKNLVWGLNSGYSYGNTIDTAFAAYQSHKIHHSSDPHSMLQLLAKQRLDIILIEPEELAWRIQQEPELAVSIRVVPLADAPPSFTRHIMCSNAVDPAIMNRINAALLGYMGTDEYRRLIDSATHP